MGKMSQDDTTEVIRLPGLESRVQEIAGWTVSFDEYTQDMDPAEYFAGLPDDACQCPHFGYVFTGRVVFTYTDGSEDDIRAGEAYRITPGHTPKLYAGTSLVEFSPSDELDKTMSVVMANLEKAGQLPVDLTTTTLSETSIAETPAET